MEGVSKIFFSNEVETHALSNLHLTIEAGEFVAVTGPSGCGKSTLLSIMGLLEDHTSGSYLIHGRSAENLTAGERALLRNQTIGFVFQNFNLIGDLTVQQNVELPLTYRGTPKGPRQHAVQTALERVRMEHRAGHFPAQLSGGQQQRVAVARALVGTPLILLADEPTGNLDSANAAVVMDLLTELHSGGTTICMVTHDSRFARYAERMVNLFDGKIVDENVRHGAAGALQQGPHGTPSADQT